MRSAGLTTIPSCHPIPETQKTASDPNSLQAAVALEPGDWDAEIGGLTVFTRLLRALERRGVASKNVVRSLGERRSEIPLGPGAGSRGATLILTVPVLVDPPAIAFIEQSAVEPGFPAVLMARSRGQWEAVGFLVAANDGHSLKEILDFPGDQASASLPSRDRGRRLFVTTGLFQPWSDETRAAARAALRRSLTKPTDGFLASWINRKISTRVSLHLARTGVTPNQVTLFALLPALGGAALLAVPRPAWSAAGAVLFWISTVLDGCDGEVARLTCQESPRGARLDLLCDNIVLVAVFAAVVVHVARQDGGITFAFLGAAILVGMLGCMVTEYVRILRPRIDAKGAGRAPAADRRAARVLWYERLASRDFACLLPFLAWFGSLRYLVWATAVGVNVFWAVLVTFVTSRPKELAS